ncbi:mitochondrial import inner membrane translocase subunit tim13 [Colletotrichum incanum]|nr:mitochondrial import inner membrane translocase subunit tim13 [Colletotrichum incanum]
MDSDSVKKAVMKQVLQEANLANARVLIEFPFKAQWVSDADAINYKQKLQENCFEKCVPKPGSSLSSGETTCMTSCMEKYMSAWNQVNNAYINRIKQESGNANNFL